MSGNSTNSSSGWVRKSSPSKQGPMKATLPMSSLTKQSSKDLKKCKSNSPVLSAAHSLWKTRTSDSIPIQRIRSPGAYNYCKGKCEPLYSTECYQLSMVDSCCIRRTASLDTIYLTGQWPRDLQTSLLQVDKWTQTDDCEGKKNYKHGDSCFGEEKLEKIMRHRLLQRCSVASSKGFLPVTQVEHASQTNPFPIPSRQKQPMRSSIEGLNQEIERLVLKAMTSLSTEREEEKVVQMTPEGHRAPLADLLGLTRSVNTQTPAYSSSQSSGASSRQSDSPLVLGSRSIDNSRPPSTHNSGSFGGSGDSSPDQESSGAQLGTSPRINRFLAREPPDGCERVSLKFQEDTGACRIRDLSLMDYCPLKPTVTFQLKPSLGSAFQPLQSIASTVPVETAETSSSTGLIPSPSYVSYLTQPSSGLNVSECDLVVGLSTSSSSSSPQNS